jgi:hypothetical protein
MIESVLNVTAIYFLMYNIKESTRNSLSILLQNLILMIFMVKNAHSVVTVEIGRVSKSTTTRKTSW